MRDEKTNSGCSCVNVSAYGRVSVSASMYVLV